MKTISTMLIAIATVSAFALPARAANVAKTQAKAAVHKVVSAKKVPAKAVTIDAAAADQALFEAMAKAGGPEYRDATSNAAKVYITRMDARCQAPSVDISNAVKEYSVYTPPGTEAARDRLIKKYVVALACTGKYTDGVARAARLKM